MADTPKKPRLVDQPKAERGGRADTANGAEQIAKAKGPKGGASPRC